MSRRDRLHNCRREDVARAIVMLQQAGHLAHVELFRGVMQGAIGLGVISSRETPWNAADVPSGAHPTILLIGDDDYCSTGPPGWRAARGALSWTRAAIVHGAGATPECYRDAVIAAVHYKRLLLVETDFTHMEEWAAAVAGKPTLKVVPTDGLHPIAPLREMVQ